MSIKSIYEQNPDKAYAANPFDRRDPALPEIERPQLPNDIVLNILRYLPISKTHEIMTLTKSEMGVNRVEYHKNLLTYKTELTAKDLHQYRKIFSIGSPQPKSWSEVFSDLTFSNITHLDLSKDETLTDSDLIAILKACPNLTSLNLDTCKEITDASILELVKNASKLTSINLKCTKITDASLKALSEHCPNLIAINLMGTKTSTEEIKSFAKSHPNLTEIHLTKKDLLDADVQELSLSLPLLESISLAGCSFVGDLGIQELAKNCPNLTSIKLLSPVRIEGLRAIRGGITDTGLNALATYSKKLTSITLVWCKQITPAGIENLLKNCPMTSLVLKECYQTNNSRVKSMAPLCSNLTTLDLDMEEPDVDRRGHYLNDDGLAELAKYATKLTSINLSEKKRITINGVKELARNCPNLVSVNLYLTRIRDEAVKEFEQEFPKVKIERNWVQY